MFSRMKYTHSKSVSKLWCCLSHSQESQVWEPRGKNLTIVPFDILANFCLPSETSSHTGLKVLVPKGGILYPGTQQWLIELEVETATWTLWLFIPLNQKAKKGVTVLAGVTDSDCPGPTGLLLHNGDKGKCILNVGDLLGHLLIFPWPMIKVNDKL